MRFRIPLLLLALAVPSIARAQTEHARADSLHARQAKDSLTAIYKRTTSPTIRRYVTWLKAREDTLQARAARLTLRTDTLVLHDTVTRVDTVRVTVIDTVLVAQQGTPTDTTTTKPADTTVVTPPPPPVDSSPTNPPPAVGVLAPNVSPTGAIVAEVPRVVVNTAYPTVLRVVNVPAGTSLQAAINAARGGDELRLADCAAFVGNFTLPTRSDTGWVVIRAAGSLPGPGTRMTPTKAGQLCLPKILTPNYSEAIGTAIGAHGWRLDGVEIGAQAGVPEVNMLVRFGYSDATQTSLAQVPSGLVLSRSYVHGNATMKTARCVTLNSGATAVVDSWLSECHHSDKDSQGVWGSNGPGPFTITNNHVEGGHQALFFGGASPNIAQLIPSDIYVAGNHFTRPLSWRCASSSVCNPGQWRTKTIIETKNARRMLVEGNIIENVWADAQAGFAVLLKSEDQDGVAPWTQSVDITVRNNVLRRVASGFNLSANPGWAPALPAARITITNNTIESFDTTGDHIPWQFAGITDATVTHNTALNTLSNELISFTGAPLTRLTFDANVGYVGLYGIHSDPGSGAPGTAWRTNAIIGGNIYPQSCPTGAICPTSVLTPWPSAFDGKAIGADPVAVQQATAGAEVAP